MFDAILGTRIRQRRRQIGVTQAGLARQLGISASYLNLIEHNKRRIAGPLLRQIAEHLDLAPEELDGAAERRLAETLTEIAHLPVLAGLRIDAGGAGDLIARHPGWARALTQFVRAESAANQTARALSDRLTHDPFLGEAVHRMLTRISALRSAAEILTDYGDVPKEDRERFHRIIRDEAESLTDVGEALASYFDKDDEAERALTPIDEVEALFEARENHFAELEGAATALGGQASELGPAAARQIATERLGDRIEAIVEGASQIETVAARNRARQQLTDYAAGAVLMPLTAFAPRAVAMGYDIEALAADISVGVDAICQRLTALPAAPVTPRFGYIRANASGTIIQMLGLAGLALPRYAAACPLWVLYRAQQTPEHMMRQHAVFPNGGRFVFIARTRRTGRQGFGAPRHYLTDMLAMTEADAAHTVYATAPDVPVEEVGPACRLCPRTGCGHRVADPLAG